MTTAEMLAKTQLLALQEQAHPGHPDYEKEFRLLLLELAEHLDSVDQIWTATLRTAMDTNEDLLRTLSEQTTLITQQAARIAQLTATLEGRL